MALAGVTALPSILISVGVSGWQAIEHEKEWPALKAHLRANLNAMLDRTWRQLMEDPVHGAIAPVNHMAVQVENGIPGLRPLSPPVHRER